MLKKTLIVTGILGAVVLFVPTIRSHVAQGFSWARSEVDEAVPIEYRLEQAERELAEMTPEIQAARHAVAEEEVEIEGLESDLVKIEGQLMRDTARLQEQSGALRKGATQFVVAGRTYSRETLAYRVQTTLEQHQRRSSLLESRRKTLAARMKSLDAARDRVDSMVAERDRLGLAIDELRALLRENQALEAARGTHAFDDSRLSEVAKHLEGIRKKLKVQRKVIEQSDPVLGPITRATSLDPSSVGEAADRYLAEIGAPNEGQAAALKIEGR